MGFDDNCIVEIQEMKLLRFGSRNPVADVRHLGEPSFLHDYPQLSARDLFEVSALIEHPAQFWSIDTSYNIV